MVSHASSYGEQTVACRMVRPSVRSLTKVPRIAVLIVSQNAVFDAHVAVSFAGTPPASVVAPSRTKALSLVLI